MKENLKKGQERSTKNRLHTREEVVDLRDPAGFLHGSPNSWRNVHLLSVLAPNTKTERDNLGGLDKCDDGQRHGGLVATLS